MKIYVFILPLSLFTVNANAEMFESQCRELAIQTMTKHPEALVKAIKESGTTDYLRQTIMMNCQGIAILSTESKNFEEDLKSLSNLPEPEQTLVKEIVPKAYEIGTSK